MAFILEIRSSQWSTMKQVVVDSDTTYLPEEIIVNILKRVPVKSLIRFQCVCKHWKNLIKTQSFVEDHLHHSSNQNPSLLFENFPVELFLFDCEMQVRGVQNAPWIGSSSSGSIIGSCNGLLCVEIYNDKRCLSPPSLLLYNPAIREVRQVPRTINVFEVDYALGFGFSLILNDYKIVRTFAEPFGVVNRAEVYSLSTGLWKEIQFRNLEGVSLGLETVTINGTIFWVGIRLGVEEDGEDDIDLIVSFDIATEVFTLIPWPPIRSNSYAKFTIYENKLAILFNPSIRNFKHLIDLWVMEEGIGASGERWSWSKKYTSGPYPSQLLFPVTIWRNEIVCSVFGMQGLIRETEGEVEHDKSKDGLCLFNLTTNEVTMFTTGRWAHTQDIFNYVESLVPLRDINIEKH